MSIFFQESLVIILLLSGIPLIAGAVTGFTVSFLQAVTQIQEQTISYVVKIFTLIVVFLLLGEWGVAMLSEYSVRIFESIGSIAV